MTGGRLWSVGFWALIYVFLISYLAPSLIPANVVPTGGDYGSHYYTLTFLRDHLLPQGRVVGWNPGNYAGFPQFQMYFPGPFLLMVALNAVLPLAAAFKAVSLAGVLLLPWAAWKSFRMLRLSDPTPEIGAAFSLFFLFVEASPAFGGKILSTLAGEFAFALGLALALLFLGRVYRDVDSGRGVVGSALLLAAVGLCHGYPLLFSVLACAFFLFTPVNFSRRLGYLLEVNLLAFCFMGFWIVPLLAFSPYTTPFNFVWVISSLREVLPVILWPATVLAAGGAVMAVWGKGLDESERRAGRFFLFLIVAAGAFYFIAFKIGVVDVRFLPFGQLFLVLLGALVAGRLLRLFRFRKTATAAAVLAALALTAHQESQVLSWAHWNFSGWRDKPLWSAFNDVNQYLAGNFSDPRVVYEHSQVYNAAGTVRAFESLPLFAGRSVLEGVYIQASLSVPFIFYIQSETSPTPSKPLHQYNYSRFDLARARGHLALFNVGQYVTASIPARKAALDAPGYELAAEYGPLAVFDVAGGATGYAVHPEFEPVWAVSQNIKRDSFAWFRWADPRVPLVFANETPSDGDLIVEGEPTPAALSGLPKRPLPEAPQPTATLENGRIRIRGATPGLPLWVKVSYHPNWRAQGAGRVFRTAPSFMLVYPEQPNVTLHFGWTWPDCLGVGLTVLAVGRALLLIVRRRPKSVLADLTAQAAAPLSPWATRRRKTLLVGGVALVAAAALTLIVAVGYEDPVVYYNRGLKHFTAGDYESAARVFGRAADKFPLSPVIGSTLHHLALSHEKRGRNAEARRVWVQMEAQYPESPILPEAVFHLGRSYEQDGRVLEAAGTYEDVIAFFPDSKWSEYARQRLIRLEARP